MATIKSQRRLFFVALALCVLTVLGISVYYQSQYFPATAATLNLGIASPALTVIAILTALISDRKGNGAAFSLVWFELTWTGLLSVLWVGTAGYFTSFGGAINCSNIPSYYVIHCHLNNASLVLSWISWVLLFLWFVTLLALSIRSQSKGNKQIWQTPTKDANFFGPFPPQVPQQHPASFVYPGNMINPAYVTAPAPPTAQVPYHPQSFVFYGPPPPGAQPGPNGQPPAPQMFIAVPQQAYAQQGYPTPAQPQLMQMQPTQMQGMQPIQVQTTPSNQPMYPGTATV